MMPVFGRVLTAMVRIGTEADWASVSAGETRACGIRRDRSLWCWPTHGPRADLVPARVGAEADWASVSVGSGHTCAVRTTHTLWCWGGNEVGQLGDGTTRSRPAPVRVGTDANWAGVSVGADRTCAVRTTHTLWCWGDRSSGGLFWLTGRAGRRTPGRVGTGADWASVAVAVAADHETGPGPSCAVRRDHTLWCWGWNGYGQLGYAISVLRRVV